MQYFRPIDEMSLRHLFSSDLGESVLKMSYIGPVLGANGSPETSPDCLILDKRDGKWKIKRCEFKYQPRSKEDFRSNGCFDIAIIWSLPSPLSKENLKNDLLKQNNCEECIVLSEYQVLDRLPEYPSQIDIENFYDSDQLRKALMDIGFPSVYCVYIAAEICPKMFRWKTMKETLLSKFAEVRKRQTRGIGNLIGVLVQKKPYFIVRKNNDLYQFNREIINPELAKVDIGFVIINNFEKELPDTDTISQFKNADLD